MEARAQRGLEIAATEKLRRKGDVWIVPSQSKNGRMYQVDVHGAEPTCSCPDHETRRVKCKHIQIDPNKLPPRAPKAQLHGNTSFPGQDF